MVLDDILLDDPINIYYLTGIYFSSARLLIHKNKQTLFVDGRYAEKAKSHFPHEVVIHKNIDEAVANRLQGPAKISISSNDVHLDRYLAWQKMKRIEWVPKPNLLAPLRMIKSKEEVRKIEAACQITSLCYSDILSCLKQGITEREVAKKVEIFFLENGADGLAFPPIIGFGTHSAIPHHSPTDRSLKKGDLVQFDIGCKKDHYCSDFSRVHFFGAPDPKLQEIAKIVQEAKLAAEQVARIGTPVIEVDQAARTVIEKYGYKDQFLHSIGHGLGLEIHEPPLVRQTPNQPLQEGMVITIEPGIYLEGLGGVRLEDTYLITSSIPQNLTERKHAHL